CFSLHLLLPSLLFFFAATPTSATSTLSLHDALPIFKFFPYVKEAVCFGQGRDKVCAFINIDTAAIGNWAARRKLPYTGYADKTRDRKSTRLNSSHLGISYAVFCLKKKKKTNQAIKCK